MANLQSYIGATLSIAVATDPATYDAAGYAALTWVNIGKVMSIPEIGDSHNMIDIDILSDGRVKHVIGSADGGMNQVTIAADGDDTGQTSLLTANGSNTQNAFRIVDPAPSSETIYFSGLVAGLKDTERTTTAYKGKTFTMAVNTAVVRA